MPNTKISIIVGRDIKNFEAIFMRWFRSLAYDWFKRVELFVY